jgi:succinate dehydrogenase / fumarate reductase, iron-sulfur subunit
LEYTFRVKRYDPDVDVKPHFEEYAVDLEPSDRVLDGLNEIKWRQDGTLTYRRSCAHGVCGSDAMRINGRNYLACKTLMKEFGKKITIEPLIGFTVIKDLVVDMDQFFASYKAIKPYLIAGDAPASEERLQTPEQLDRYEEATKCILCASCTTSCPITWTNESFVGAGRRADWRRLVHAGRRRRQRHVFVPP